MGKKTKKEKKGKGKEKTAAKTEKKADKKAKKELAAKGEDDIERLIAEFQEKDRRLVEVIEDKCSAPSPRSSMTLTAHPEKDELIMFGGEYLTGNKMTMFNELLFYNIKKNEWMKVSSPNPPPPRSSHQAVCLPQGGGQMWVFGGEFSSPTQSQFYHYKDLWVLHLKDRRWEKIESPGGPSSRSGHRMVSYKKQLFVFGGFHDNIRDYKYYNDVHIFDLETYKWTKLEVNGVGPCPRSACQMAVLPTLRRIYVFGGYSKERLKKDVDKGKVHTDLYCLTPEGKAQEGASMEKWKWQVVKQSGARPSPRCGMTLAVVSLNRALAFGGVHDEEENEEEMESVFFNELYCLELDKGKWFNEALKGKKEMSERKKRRKVKDEDKTNDDDDEDIDEEALEGELEAPQEGLQKLNIENEQTEQPMEATETEDEDKTTFDDGVFKVTLGGDGADSTNESTPEKRLATDLDVKSFRPCARMNALMAVKNGVLFLYGGIFEDGDKQVTLSDMYSLDVHRLDEWKTLIEPGVKSQTWEDSDSSDEEGGGAKAMECDDGSEDSDETDDSDEDMELTFDGAEPLQEGEELSTYFSRTEAYWIQQAQDFSDREKLGLGSKHRKQLALDLAQSFFKKVKK